MWNEIYWQYRYPEMHIYLSSRTKHLVSSCRRKQHLKCPILSQMCTLCPACECPGGLDMQDENVCLKPPGSHQRWCPNGASHPDLSNTFPQDPIPHADRDAERAVWRNDVNWQEVMHFEKHESSSHPPFNILFLPLIKFMVQWWNFHFIYLVS